MQTSYFVRAGSQQNDPKDIIQSDPHLQRYKPNRHSVLYPLRSALAKQGRRQKKLTGLLVLRTWTRIQKILVTKTTTKYSRPSRIINLVSGIRALHTPDLRHKPNVRWTPTIVSKTTAGEMYNTPALLLIFYKSQKGRTVSSNIPEGQKPLGFFRCTRGWGIGYRRQLNIAVTSKSKDHQGQMYYPSQRQQSGNQFTVVVNCVDSEIRKGYSFQSDIKNG